MSDNATSENNKSRIRRTGRAAQSGLDVLLSEAARCIHPGGWAVKLPFALPHLSI